MVSRRLKEYVKDFSPEGNIKSLTTNIKGDIVGGVTAAVVALPVAVAFGIVSGLGIQAGIYGAIIVGFFASLFGGTPAQISGPTAPMTVIVTSIFLLYRDNLAFVFGLIALSGIIQMIFAFTKVGKYVQYFPLPVVSGFMTGIGLIIFIMQFNPFFGMPAASNVGAALQTIAETLVNLNKEALAVGIVTLLSVYLTPRLIKGMPGILGGLVVGTTFSRILGFSIPIIGPISIGLPRAYIPQINWETFRIMLGPATAMAVLGLLDTLLTSLVCDRMTKTHHNSNRELFGQGIGNFFSGLFGGLPGAGVTIRTKVNIQSGGKTPLSGMVHALCLVLIVTGL
ncbi:MAG: hypothetical protein KKC84_05840, partial [Candidatus Omnitrophica bacterium]|nr:hypothetical protein [Candidatus Omnitrophota bacterium]